MRSGVDVLRDFWRQGVRVELADDRFRLTPAGVAPESLRHVLREHRSDVAAVLEHLPAPGRCPLCSDSTGWAEKTQLHCTDCALIAAERLGLCVQRVASSGYISTLSDAKQICRVNDEAEPGAAA